MSDTAYIAEARRCDFDCDNEAGYDFRTAGGPWANGCEDHWLIHRASEQLGTGHGQRLIVGEKPKTERSAIGQATLAEMVATLGGDEDEILMLADDMGYGDLFE